MNYKISGQEVRFDFCPVCNKEKKDNPCFSVNRVKMKWSCFTTGQGGDVKDLQNFDFDFSVLGEIPEAIEIQPDDVKNNLKDVIYSLVPIAKNSKWTEYLKGRGITTPKIAQVCALYKGNMMMPVTNGEEVVGIKYRSIDKKLWSEKGSKSEYFMNWQNVSNDSQLIICEGEIDLLSCLEVGLDDVVSLPLGIQNLKCILKQKDWLKTFKKIIIATDNDEPGIKGKNEIVKLLDDIKEVLYEVDLGDFKDLNEVLVKSGKEALKKIFKSPKKLFQTNEPFFEMNGGYYSKTKFGIQQVADFLIEVTGYSDNTIKGTVTESGRTKEFKVLKSDVISKEGFVRNIGFFLGGASKIINFWHWILKKNSEKYLKEIDFYGFVDKEFYHPGSEVICNKNDLIITNPDEVDEMSEEDMTWINENLIYLRSEVNQSLLGICWALGRYSIQEAYPILEVAGTTSIGKTEYVEFISRLMFGSKENIKSFTALSNHQIRSISSCSNLTCWAIDEVKITGKNLKEKAIDLYSNIRSVYDNKTVNQGNISNKLSEFKLKTPLIISGESELSDVSIKNRMISVKLTPHNKSEEDVFVKLKHSDILEKFAKYALSKKEKIELTNIEVRDFLKDVKDERQLYNGKCILTGFKFLCKLIKIDNEIKLNFIKYLNKLLSDSYSVEENFKYLLDLVIDSGKDFNHFYIKTKTEHCGRFNMLYKAIAEEHNKTNSTLELLDARTLKKQLIECGFILEKDKVKKMQIDEFSKELKSCRVDIFKIVTELS